MSVVDAHCHLDIADGEDGDWLSPAEAIKLAKSVGVTRIVQVGCDLPGAVWAVEAADAAPEPDRRRRPAPERGAEAEGSR